MISCSFCSNPYQIQRHHIISAAWLGHKSFENATNLIPVCKECNCFLSDFVFSSIEEMTNYLVKCYRKKYKKVLNLSEWSDDDFEELSNSLEIQVRERQALKRATMARIESIQQFGYR